MALILRVLKKHCSYMNEMFENSLIACTKIINLFDSEEPYSIMQHSNVDGQIVFGIKTKC